MNIEKSVKINGFFIMLLFLYSLWKFYPSFGHQYSIATMGDGYGTIANYQEVLHSVRTGSVKDFFDDTMQLEFLGNGALGKIPVNSFQKILITLFSVFVQRDDIYDLYGMIGFFLVGVAAFLFMRELELDAVIAMLLSLIFMNNDNIQRYGFHLTLGIIVMPIVVVWQVFRAAKSSTLKNHVLLSFFAVMNFLMSEYYGFLGFFVIIIFYVLFSIHFRNKIDRQLVKYILISSSIFIVGMMAFYPNLIAGKIIQKIVPIQVDNLTTYQRGYEEYVYYSVKNPLYFFSPGIQAVKNIFPSFLFTRGVFGEQATYRIGLFIPFFILFTVIALGILKLRNKQGIGKDLSFILFSALGIAFLIILSNDPRYWISLVPLLYKISENFRVSARIYIYIFIILMLLFAYCVRIVQKRIERNPQFSLLKKAVLVGAIVLALIDATGKTAASRIGAFPLPKSGIYEELGRMEKGLVVELPFSVYPPEAAYEYYYNYVIHGNHILNAGMVPSHEFFHEYMNLQRIISVGGNEALEVIKNVGVRYVVINEKDIKNWSALNHRNDFVLKIEDGGKRLYEIPKYKKLSQDDTRKAILDLYK